MIIQFADLANQRSVFFHSTSNGSEKLEINLALLLPLTPPKKTAGKSALKWELVPIIRKHGNVHVVCEKLFTYKLDKIYGKTFGPKHKSGRVHPSAAIVQICYGVVRRVT